MALEKLNLIYATIKAVIKVVLRLLVYAQGFFPWGVGGTVVSTQL